MGNQDKTNQPIWVLDWLAWLENISKRSPNGGSSCFAQQFQELHGELPGQLLSGEFWLRSVDSDASVADDAETYETEELKFLTEEGKNRLQKELNAATAIENEKNRAKAIAEVVKQLPTSALDLLQQAFDALTLIENEHYRSWTISRVFAKKLPVSEPKLLQEVLETAKSFESEHHRALVITALAESMTYSDLKFQHQVLEAAKALEDDCDRAVALAATASQMPCSECYTILQQAIDAIQLLKPKEILHIKFFKVITAVAPYLPTNTPNLLQRLLDIARACGTEPALPKAIADLAAHIPTNELSLYQQALEAAKAIGNEQYRAEAIAAVAAYLPAISPKLYQQALEAAKAIENEQYRAEAIAAVAAYLPAIVPKLLQQVLETAKANENEQYRAEAIAAVAAYLPAKASNLLQPALAATETIKNEQYRALALAAVAERLSVIDINLTQQALTTAKSIKSKQYRAEAIAVLATKLPAGERQTVLKQELEFAEESEDEYFPAEAIYAFYKRLSIKTPKSLHSSSTMKQAMEDEDDWVKESATHVEQILIGKCEAALKRAFKAAQADKSEGDPSEMIVGWIEYLPASAHSLVKEALEVTLAFDYEPKRLMVFTHVVERIPISLPNLLEQALAIAKSFKGSYFRESAIASVAKQLPISDSKRVVQFALNLDNRNHQITALSKLAFQAPEVLLRSWPQSQYSTLLDVVPAGKGSADKAKLLVTLAPCLSSGLLVRALKLIQTDILHPLFQSECLSNLAPYLNPTQLTEALELLQNDIPGYSHPTKALCSLIPYLDIEKLDRVLGIAKERQLTQHSSLLIQLIHAIGTRLKGPYISQHLTEKADIQQSIIQTCLEHIQNNLLDERDITTAIVAIAPICSHRQIKILDNLLRRVSSEFYQTQVLTAFSQVSQLSSEQLTPYCHQVAAIQDERLRTTTLCSFIAFFPTDTTLKQILRDLIKLRDQTPNPILKVELALLLAIRYQHNLRDDCNALEQLTFDQIKALRVMREVYINGPVDLASALVQLAPHLLKSQLPEAQSIAQDIQDSYQRARALLALAAYFPSVREEAERQIATLAPQTHIHEELNASNQDYETQAIQFLELLSQFTIIVPESIPTLLKAIEAWAEDHPFKPDPDEPDPNTFGRCRILLALRPHLPVRLDREIERQTGLGKASKDLWVRTLFVLRNDYRQALKSGSLLNDAAQNEDLLSLKDEIDALTEMLLMRDLVPPVAVGILGGWGSGKSYIMHLMQRHMVTIRNQSLDPEEAWGLTVGCDIPDNNRVSRYVGHIYQIKFDAWTYSKANLWASLMQTIFFGLDRQITLEQQVQKALDAADISPLNARSGNLWQALYETNEEDRQWLIEHALDGEALNAWQENAQIQSDQDQLWELFSNVQQEAIDHLHKLEERLTEQKDVAQKRRVEIFKEAAQASLLSTMGQAAFAVLNARLGDSFAKDMENVIEQFTKAGQDLQSTQVQATKWHDSMKADIETMFAKQDGHIDRKFVTEFVRKNWLFSSACLSLLLAAIFIPLGIAQLGANQILQVFSGLTPLFGSIVIAQGLFKKGEALYDEVKLSLVDLKHQLEQGIQHKLDTDKKFRTLNRQVKLLEKDVEAQYAAIPTNVYASIGEFVSAQLQSSGYQKHLGIMHQVKEDLALLSKRLLPPPANSKEYTAKIKQLQQVFPRGPARVVLYIDDLDRCPPKSVVEVLEAVQLLVKNPLFIAVLAIDERYINRALAHHYKGVLSLQGRPSAADYLEKIIQIPYRVRPIAEEALHTYLRAQVVVQDSATSGNKFNELSLEEFNLLIHCCQEVELSPRSLKRLANVYKLYKVLSRTRGYSPSPREQKATLTLLAFSSRYPDIMRDIIGEIGSYYEEGRHQWDKSTTLANIINTYLDTKIGINPDSILVQDVKKLHHDVSKLLRDELLLTEIQQIFDFVRSFSFVGDIGFDYSES